MSGVQLLRTVICFWRAQYQLSSQRGLGRAFIADRRAITAVEYAIIVGIMVVAIVLSIPTIGPSIKIIFSSVSAEL